MQGQRQTHRHALQAMDKSACAAVINEMFGPPMPVAGEEGGTAWTPSVGCLDQQVCDVPLACCLDYKAKVAQDTPRSCFHLDTHPPRYGAPQGVSRQTPGALCASGPQPVRSEADWSVGVSPKAFLLLLLLLYYYYDCSFALILVPVHLTMFNWLVLLPATIVPLEASSVNHMSTIPFSFLAGTRSL
jgi:hypothetical protein